MAMSKKCFTLFLLGLFLLLGGGIALIVVFKNKDLAQDDSSESKAVKDSSTESDVKYSKNPSASTKRSDDMCQKLLRSPNRKIGFPGQFTKSRIATRDSVFTHTREKIVRNAYWLTGDKASDSTTLNEIRIQACMGKIPVVVIRMRPNTGLELTHAHSNWDYYKPKSSTESWADYDKKLKKHINGLSGFSAMVILEPDLLMFAYDSESTQHRWNNKKYENEFLIRAQRVVKKLPRARVYLDAGNAQYLGNSKANLDQMAKTLLRVTGLQGFSINTFHFVNQTLNEFYARQLYCRTGLHYVIDTSRNGGSFSKQPLPQVEKCLFDPPDIKKGAFPGWAWGSPKPVKVPRFKRWINQIGSSSNQISENSNSLEQRRPAPSSRPTPRPLTGSNSQPSRQIDRNDPNWKVNHYNNMMNNQKNNNNNGETQHRSYDNIENNMQANQRRNRPTESIRTNEVPSESAKNGLRSVDVAAQYLRSFKLSMRSCLPRKSNLDAHDANVWMKAAGESDGRLYRFGIFRPCLIDHAIPCDDSCQVFVQRDSNSRDSNCQCSLKKFDVNERAPPRNFFPLNDFPPE